jgi:hypothetical protein
VFYKRVIAPYKGELEMWYQSTLIPSLLDLQLIFMTAWVILVPTSKLYEKWLKDLAKAEFLIITKSIMQINFKIKQKIRSIFDEVFASKIVRKNRENENLLADHLQYTYSDQKGQVDYLINNIFNYEKFGLKKNGFFVDLACADGVHINNSYFLEKHLGWSGLLFEPNPGYRDLINANRSSPLITKCVTDAANQTVRFRIDNGMLGGIVSDDTDNNKSLRGSELKNAEIIEIETTTLVEELDKINSPSGLH